MQAPELEALRTLGKRYAEIANDEWLTYTSGVILFR